MSDSNLKFIIAGHVDHGKSTLIGRILYEAGSIPQDKLKEAASAGSGIFSFAHFLDSFEEERANAMTIDTTQAPFRVEGRDYTIIDAPGHREFIKNMMTGASYANAAVLIVDVSEGLKEQSRRHAYLLSLFGIKEMIVAVNKMDMVDYSETDFERTRSEIDKFLNGGTSQLLFERANEVSKSRTSRLGLRPRSKNKNGMCPHFCIPISALNGDNVASRSKKMAWYRGPTLFDAIGALKKEEKAREGESIFAVQDIYKVDGQDIAVGRVEAGEISVGETMGALPRGGRVNVKSIERFQDSLKKAKSGASVGLCLEGSVPIKRGDIFYSSRNLAPSVSDKFAANIFILSDSIKRGEKLTLKCGMQEVSAVLEEVEKRIDSSTLEESDKTGQTLGYLDIGKVTLRLDAPIFVKRFSDLENMGRFVLLKNGSPCAGGVVIDAM